MGECIDYYGVQEGKYYVNGGLDRFKEGISEEYLDDYLKYNFDDLIILPVKSDPVTINTDNDEVDDFYDIEPVLGINEWSNCLASDNPEDFKYVEDHCLVPVMIDGIEYYECMNCDINPIISPDYQEIYDPESLGLTNENFAMLSALRYLYTELTKQGKLEEAEIVYRIIDKIRTINYQQHYYYQNSNDHYASPINYSLTDENNDYCAELHLYNLYDETLEDEVKGIESDLLGMISSALPLSEVIGYYMTVSNAFNNISEDLISGEYYDAFKATSKTMSSEILKKEKSKLSEKLLNNEYESEQEKINIQERIKGIDDVQNIKKSVSAFKYVRKYALPLFAQGSFIFNNYQFPDVYSMEKNMYYVQISLNNKAGGNVYKILYDCSINSDGQSDINIYGSECVEGFANPGHYTDKLTIEYKNSKWEPGIVGKYYKVNDFLGG